jgi:hypothetical protein
VAREHPSGSRVRLVGGQLCSAGSALVRTLPLRSTGECLHDHVEIGEGAQTRR